MKLRLTPSLYGVIFLVSLALLNTQVSATRLMAYRFFYHFVFFVISLSQLGLAAAGAWVYASERESYTYADVEKWLVRLSLFVLATLVAYATLTPRPVIYLKVAGFWAILYLLAIAIPLIGLNFAGGMVLTILFTQFRNRMSLLYAADLAGAGAGCLVSVGLMWLLNPIRAFLISGLLALVCAAILSRAYEGGAPAEQLEEVQEEAEAVEKVGAGKSFRTLLAVALCLGILFPSTFDPNRKHGLDGLIHRYSWDHLSRTDAIEPTRYLIDGRSGTWLEIARTTEDGPVDELPEYVLAAEKPRVAILGVGAGPQLIEALAAKSRKIVALDINAPIIEWSLHEDREENKDIFYRPGVVPLIDEGRHFIQSTQDEFDLLVMFGLDTFTASAQGAYSMTENFLYTIEAFQDFLKRLAPQGILAIRRWLFFPPRENMRLFTTALKALELEGHPEPEKHILILAPVANWKEKGLQTPSFVFFSKSPLSDEQLAKMDTLVERKGWNYLYRPGARFDTPFHDLVEAEDREAYIAGYRYLIHPTTDENPFFFQLTHPWDSIREAYHATQSMEETWVWFLYHQSSVMLGVTLSSSILFTLCLMGVPLYRKRKELVMQSGLKVSWLYFTCLGIGFMAFELPVIQITTLFLGHPTYALSFVLLGLLLAAGSGSFLVHRLPRGAIRPILVGIAVLAVLTSWYLLPAVHAWLHLPLTSKMGLTLVYLVLIGIPLGIPFSAGIREVEQEGPHKVAWSWASNGAASVVGSCLLMVLLVYLGSLTALHGAAGCYLVAAVCFGSLARESGGDRPPEEASA